MFYKYVCAKSIVHISRYILCVQTKEHTHTEETPELQLNPPNYTRGLYISPLSGTCQYGISNYYYWQGQFLPSLVLQGVVLARSGGIVRGVNCIPPDFANTTHRVSDWPKYLYHLSIFPAVKKNTGVVYWYGNQTGPNNYITPWYSSGVSSVGGVFQLTSLALCWYRFLTARGSLNVLQYVDHCFLTTRRYFKMYPSTFALVNSQICYIGSNSFHPSHYTANICTDIQ